MPPHLCNTILINKTNKMENQTSNPNLIYLFWNHDNFQNGHYKFMTYTVAAYNDEYGTNYMTPQEASDEDPEYLFTSEYIENLNNDADYPRTYEIF